MRCLYKQLTSRLPGAQLWKCWSWQGLCAELCSSKGGIFQFNVFFCQSFWVVVKLWDSRGKSNALQVLKTIQEIIYDNLRQINSERTGEHLGLPVCQENKSQLRKKAPHNVLQPKTIMPKIARISCVSWGKDTLQFCILRSTERSPWVLLQEFSRNGGTWYTPDTWLITVWENCLRGCLIPHRYQQKCCRWCWWGKDQDLFKCILNCSFEHYYWLQWCFSSINHSPLVELG